jgi:hypothetical protein
MVERFDKSEEYTAFWDAVLGDDEYSEEDAEFFRNRPLDNPRWDAPKTDNNDLPY